jgi:hypothetical protein
MVVPLIVIWHLLTPHDELAGGGRALQNKPAS